MFDKFQKQSAQFFKEHKELTPKEAELLDWGLGLGEESGEVLSVLKHSIFHHEEMDKMKLAKELGDVMWYIAALCTASDINMSAVAELNANKLAHRYANQGYNDAASSLRRETEGRFEETLIYKNLEAKILRKPAPLNVIFVGPDGSGKTTISKAVQQAMADEGFTYHKCNYEQDNKPQLCMDLLSAKANVIYDRFYYPDDIIYSRIVHERESTEPIDWNTDYWRSYNEVLDTLCNLNTVFFLVTAEPEVLQERAAQWADDYVHVDDLQKIGTLYDRWRRFLVTRPVLLFDVDTSEKSLEDSVKFCVDCIRKSQAVFADMDINTYLDKEESTDGQDHNDM